MSKFVASVAALTLSAGALYGAEKLSEAPLTSLAPTTEELFLAEGMVPVVKPIGEIACPGMRNDATTNVVPEQESLDFELVTFYTDGAGDATTDISDLASAELPLEAIRDDATHAEARYIIDRKAAEIALNLSQGGDDAVVQKADIDTAKQYVDFIDCDPLRLNVMAAIAVGKSEIGDFIPNGSPANTLINRELTPNQIADPFEYWTQDHTSGINEEIATIVSQPQP